jgi:hypothetical protein
LTQPGSACNRSSQEPSASVAALISSHLDERHPGRIIDGDVEKIMSSRWLASFVTGIGSTQESVATAERNTPQLFDVEVQELTRSLPDIPNRHRRRPIKRVEPRQSMSTQHAVDRRATQHQLGGQPMRPCLQFTPGGQDSLHQIVGQDAWSMMRSR